MKSIVSTINAIDENSKKIVYKHFDQTHVNILAKEGPNIVEKLNEIQKAGEKDMTDKFKFNSEGFMSDSSGNKSEGDELQNFQQLK